jgi:ABC-2 type transport system ATP-binding protein
VRDYRKARALVGLVPQELNTDAFETVRATTTFSRGLYGKNPDPALIDRLLGDLSLLDKRDEKIMALSGGMKRRVMIAKALSHEPKVLFLDEPTAGVDVELRRDMWRMVRGLKDRGVTIILTTHYIEEAEELADRVGVINKGEIILLERTDALMARLGKKHLTLHVKTPLERPPPGLEAFNLELSADGHALVYTFEAKDEGTGVSSLIRALTAEGLDFFDLQTRQSTLEDIFVDLVSTRS